MTTLQAPEERRASSHGAHRPRRRGYRPVRWALWLVALSVVLVAAVHVGGGLYFATRIEAGALASDPGRPMPAFDDVRVVTVSGSRVQLRKGADAGPSFDAPATYGLAWEGGTGTVGPATRNPDGTVTRPLKVLQGTAPFPRQGAALDRAVWMGDPPQAFPLAKMDVSVAGLPAWYFPAGPGAVGTVAIFVHGQNGTRNDALRFASAAVPAGTPVLAITYRNDLGAPRDPSGRLQHGRTEWRDLESAVDWALQQGARHVVLVGQSMGGAIVASFLERSTRRHVVSGIILEAPMLSLGSVVEHGAQDALPGGRAVPTSVLWTAQQIAARSYDLDWKAVDYLDDTDWLRIRTLVIQGADDPVVPLSLAQRLHGAKPQLVSLEVFPGAQHLESWNADAKRYASVVRKYLTLATPKPGS
ncbi:alpha/beta hydrolase [Knoellia sp. 3-2P3]|uniref:alpha/beta hydrolase n=1 Tax=unclassified Knoellia TaxID=2618719 RepID=UPI0023DAE80F|nr:alpha/beta hydrolase [Knoellia sp. 3-2P3]MDF2091065.1 alpha/beta hydrolase [Knoellia sp. 3-2P3]